MLIFAVEGYVCMTEVVACVLLACDRIYAQRTICYCLSITQVNQSKTVEVSILDYSPYSSPIPLVIVG